jgi:hypothetical protein
LRKRTQTHVLRPSCVRPDCVRFSNYGRTCILFPPATSQYASEIPILNGRASAFRPRSLSLRPKFNVPSDARPFSSQNGRKFKLRTGRASFSCVLCAASCILFLRLASCVRFSLTSASYGEKFLKTSSWLKFFFFFAPSKFAPGKYFPNRNPIQNFDPPQTGEKFSRNDKIPRKI